MASMELTSKQKAAVLMVVMGKEYSSRIYQHLSEEEIEQLTLSITSLDRIDSDLSARVIDEFYEITLALNNAIYSIQRKKDAGVDIPEDAKDIHKLEALRDVLSGK